MRTTRLFLLAAIPLAFGLTGCATKGYVNDQLADIQNRLDQQDAELAQVEGDAQSASAAAASAADEAEQLAAMARGEMRFSETRRFQVYFGYDSSELSADARAVLDDAAQVIADNPGYLVNLYGFTDARGSAAYNEALGHRRAASVQRYLLSETPVELGRFATVSFGEDAPGAWSMGSMSEEQRRQVVVSIVERVPASGSQLSQRGE